MPREIPLEDLDALRTSIDSFRPFTHELVKKLQGWLVPTFIYSSSVLGRKSAMTWSEALNFFEKEIVSGGHHIDRFLALRRHRAAYEFMEETAKQGAVIDVPIIRKIHRVLADGSRNERERRPGEWKEQHSAVTRRRGREFHYAVPDQVPDLMQRMVEGFAEVRASVHPVAAVSWFYYHFHLIHPFEAENGQVARLVATSVLLNHGYPPLIVEPWDLGPYLDALAACDITAPEDQRYPLSDKLDTTPLLEFFCNALISTGRTLLDLLEGKEVAEARDLKKLVADSQSKVLAHLLGDEELNWRVRASLEVRALHQRVETIARAMVCQGPLYKIEMDECEVFPTHKVAPTFVNSMPAGDAGVVGQLSLVISGDLLTSGLRFPEPQRLRVVTAASSVNTIVLLQWSDQRRPEVQPGPKRASEWPEASLNQLVTQSVDRYRRRFEYFLMEENLSPAARAKIKAGMNQIQERKRKITQAFLAAAVEEQLTPARGLRTTGRAEERGNKKIEGLQADQPPVDF
jgi:Fic/DOC family